MSSRSFINHKKEHLKTYFIYESSTPSRFLGFFLFQSCEFVTFFAENYFLELTHLLKFGLGSFVKLINFKKVQFCKKIKTISYAQHIVLISHTSFRHAGLRFSILVLELNLIKRTSLWSKKILDRDSTSWFFESCRGTGCPSFCKNK